MTKLGTELQVGDVIAVWWAPNRAKIRKLRGLGDSPLNASLWGGLAQVATLDAPNTKSGELEMTIEPQMRYEVEVSNG